MYNNKITKLVFQYICLSVILIDSVFRTGKYYYPQVYLEECKFVINQKKYSYLYYWWCRIFFWFCWRNSVRKNSDGKKLWLWRKFWWKSFDKILDEEKFWWRKFQWRKLKKKTTNITIKSFFIFFCKHI